MSDTQIVSADSQPPQVSPRSPLNARPLSRTAAVKLLWTGIESGKNGTQQLGEAAQTFAALYDRAGNELTDGEIQAKIEERNAKARSIRLRSYGGAFGGTVGAAFAFVALIMFESTVLAGMGFIVMGLGYAIVSPEDVIAALRRKS